MADSKTYSEDEHIAILTDRVTKETAELTAERDQQADRITELETALDVEASAKTAAEQRAAQAEQALVDYKAEIESEREAAARKDERLAKVRETAKHLGEEFFSEPKRIERIVAMSQEQFDGYVEDLASTVGAADTLGSGVPRETSMQGSPAGGTSRPAGRNFLLRHYVAPKEA